MSSESYKTNMLPENCRVCLEFHIQKKSLLAPGEDTMNLIMMFTTLINTELELDKETPSSLCQKCEEQLINSYNFQQKMKRVNACIKEFKLQLIDSKIRTHCSDTDDDDREENKYQHPELENCVLNKNETNKRKKSNNILDLYPAKDVEEAVLLFQTTNNTHTKCILCEFDSTTSKNLAIHIAHVHKNIKENWCSVCNRLFDKLKEHKSCHLNSVYACCTLCSKKVRRSYMIGHLNRHKDCAVEICGLNKSDNTNNRKKKLESRKLQIGIHIGKRPYKCSYCNKENKTRRMFLEHQRTHTGEKPYKCNICKKGFGQSAALRTHMFRHTGKPERCKICNKTFCRSAELKLHLQKHAGEKPFLCTDCGKAFSQKSHLTEHIKIHSDERPYKCNLCSQAFNQSSALKCHLNIHSGYKPLKCDHCSYACGKPYRLKQHILSQHSKESAEKSHLCRICEKAFVSTSRLKLHMSSIHNAVL